MSSDNDDEGKVRTGELVREEQRRPPATVDDRVPPPERSSFLNRLSIRTIHSLRSYYEAFTGLGDAKVEYEKTNKRLGDLQTEIDTEKDEKALARKQAKHELDRATLVHETEIAELKARKARAERQHHPGSTDTHQQLLALDEEWKNHIAPELRGKGIEEGSPEWEDHRNIFDQRRQRILERE